MTRENIIKLARDAGFNPANYMGSNLEIFERFAALVAAAEREACAKVAEVLEIKVVLSHPARVDFDPNSVMARQIAALIRARGEK